SPFFHDFVKNLYFEYELPKQTILLTTYLNAETANIKRRIASSKEFNFGPLGQSIYAFIIITPTQSQYIYSIDDFLSQRHIA
ncbi:20653_t:CDS:2, partial [Rhizophagus irregularis]